MFVIQDQCVAYTTGISNAYAIYTCNNDGSKVTKQGYGTDTTCTTVSGDPIIFNKADATEKELYSFECNGFNNVVTIKSWIFGVDCNDGIEVSSTRVAMGVCFKNKDGTYSYSQCDQNGGNKFNISYIFQ